jgi:alkylation response protein AidB-like acyl-CoA dehydrogenase
LVFQIEGQAMATIDMNEDRQLLCRTVRDLVRERAQVSQLRKLRDTKNPDGFDRALHREMSELGLWGLIVPEAQGGAELGYTELGLVAEELGRELAATPLFASVALSAGVLLSAKTGAESTLEAIATGKQLVALAYNEQPHHAPEHCATRAVKSGDGFVVSGRKTFVLDGHVADQLLVVARTSASSDRHGLTVFAMPRGTKGVRVERLGMVDSRNAAHISFDDVHVPRSAVVGEIDGAWQPLADALDRAAIVLSAEMLGGAQAAFSLTLDYLKTRKQFGVAIGTFQALKHRMADLYAELELARSVVMDALCAVDERRNDVAKMASITKARLSDVFVKVTADAIQLHGGIGVTDEHDIGLFYKRARVAELLLGDGNFHRTRYASLCGY